MTNGKLKGFDKRMQQFTEISFSTQKYLRAVNVVVKADGMKVEYYKKYATGELRQFYVFGEKSDFLNAFNCLQVKKWKKKYSTKGLGFGRSWELQIKFSDGKKICYCGENAFPENFCSLDKLFRVDYAI